MKKSSIWAKENRVKAIAILVVLHFILWWIYYFAGAYLYIQDIILPTNLKYVGALLFLTAAAFHPIKNIKQGFFKNTFARRKFWQYVAMASVAVFTILFGNHSARNLLRINNTLDFSAQTIALDIKKETKVSKKLSRKERRKLRRTFRKDLRRTLCKMRKKDREYSTAAKIGIALLTLLVAGILLYRIALLSCAIACIGAEALGFIVALGGLILVVYGVIKVFRLFGIMKQKKKSRPVKSGG